MAVAPLNKLQIAQESDFTLIAQSIRWLSSVSKKAFARVS
jgi:hypothetical protein